MPDTAAGGIRLIRRARSSLKMSKGKVEGPKRGSRSPWGFSEYEGCTFLRGVGKAEGSEENEEGESMVETCSSEVVAVRRAKRQFSY